jgi:hypothetical protein
LTTLFLASLLALSRRSHLQTSESRSSLSAASKLCEEAKAAKEKSPRAPSGHHKNNNSINFTKCFMTISFHLSVTDIDADFDPQLWTVFAPEAKLDVCRADL